MSGPVWTIVRLETGWGVYHEGGLSVVGFTSEQSAGAWVAGFVALIVDQERAKAEAMLLDMKAAGRIS